MLDFLCCLFTLASLKISPNKYQIMIDQSYANWATHYRFLKFPTCEEYPIPKKDLNTWFDLKYELEDHVHIKHEFIEIVINGRKIFYDDKTLLEDIDLKPTDVCIVVVQKEYKRDEGKEQSEQVRYREQSLSQTRLEIEKKRADPYFEQAMDSVKISKQKQSLYDELVKEYSKWQCLMAFQKCRLQVDVRKYLTSGDAKKALQQKISNDQEREIDEFLKKDDVLRLKTELLNRRGDEALYGIVMRKLFEKYPTFRKLQIGHQEYVQRKLLGKELYEDKINNRIENQLKPILQEVEKKKRPISLTEAEVNSFTNPYILRGLSGDEVNKAIKQAGNNLTLAEQYLKTGVVETANNIILCLKKTARINLVLQFFSQPAFESILPKLKQKPQKCRDFIEYIITKYKANTLLVLLIKQYKTYIETILTGVYSVDKEKNLEYKQLNFTHQLEPTEQAVQKQRILKTVNPRLVQLLAKNQIHQGLATSATRAAENDINKLEPYLLLGGINKRYDFCNRTRDNEQIYLDKYFKKEKELLNRLKDKQTEAICLGSLSETSPLLFDMIIRNKPFVDSLIAGR